MSLMAREHPRPAVDDWRDHPERACRGVNPDVFFPTEPGRGALEPAKAICAGCPVVAECLAWALDHPKQAGDGVWGGKGYAARKHLAKKRRVA